MKSYFYYIIFLIWNFGIMHSMINVKIKEKIYFKVEKMTFEKKRTFSLDIFWNTFLYPRWEQAMNGSKMYTFIYFYILSINSIENIQKKMSMSDNANGAVSDW